MRILQLVHDFLPNHVAGVEVYTNQLAQRLSVENDVALVYSEVVPDEPNYTLRRGHYGAASTYEIVNNHLYRNFRETYRNPAVDALAREILDEFQPQVVHVQHLLNLSVGLVAEIRRRGIPLLMTLHDHWFACAKGGQRFHSELGRCERLDADRCGACTASMNRLGFAARSWLQRVEEAPAADKYTWALTDAQPFEIETPSSDFVYVDRYAFEGERRPTWVAHPPTNLRFRVVAKSRSDFLTAVAMHPSTFDSEGGGVRFSVSVNGKVRAEHTLDPKRRAQDRNPLPLRAELEVGENELELRTEAVPEDRPEFCTAGWVGPRIISDGGGLRSSQRLVGDAVRRLGRSMQRFGAAAQSRRVRARWSVVKSVAEHIDLFLAPSRYLRGEFIRFGIPAERVLHCDYGFETDGFTKRRDLPERARRFAFVGSLVRHKGVHVLLEAFEQMPSDARLDVCGALHYDPAYAEGLRAAARHPGIRFPGGLPPERIPAFLAEVDCLVVPSIWQENSPLTIHEAFLAGVPVVASRMGGHGELLSAGGGLLYDADDPSGLATLLRRLYREPGLLRELAASAPPVKTMRDHVAELTSLYERLAGEPV